MRVHVQFTESTARGFQEMTIEEFNRLLRGRLPTRVFRDSDSGKYIHGLSLQGMNFLGYDHYHLEDTPWGCRLKVWRDDPGEIPDYKYMALEVEFRYLAPDPKFGGAYNTKQNFTFYLPALHPLRARLEKQGHVQDRTIKDWSEFMPPMNPMHGIMTSDEAHQEHFDRQELRGWRESAEGVPKEFVRDGRVVDQRSLGRYKIPDGTKTAYLRSSAASTTSPTHGSADHDLLISESTAGASNVSDSTTENVDATYQWVWWDWKPDGSGSNWPSGTYRAQIDCTTNTNSSYSYGVKTINSVAGHFANLRDLVGSGTPSDYTHGTTKEQVESTFTGTGLKLATTGTWNPVDYANAYWEVCLVTDHPAESAHGMGTSVFTLQLNEADDYTDGPWAPASITSVMSKANMTVTGKTLSFTSPLTLVLSKANLTITGKVLAGTISVTSVLSKAAMTATGKTLGRVLGGLTSELSKANLTATGRTLSRVLGGVTHGLSKANLTVAGKQLAVIKGGLTSVLSKANLTVTGKQLAAVKGGLTSILSKANLTITAKQMSGDAGTQVAIFAKAAMTVTGKVLSRVLGGIAPSLSRGQMTMAAKPMGVVVGGITIGMSVANMTVTAQEPSAVLGGLTSALDRGQMTMTAKAIGIPTTILAKAEMWIEPRELVASTYYPTMSAADMSLTPKTMAVLWGDHNVWMYRPEMEIVARQMSRGSFDVSKAVMTLNALPLSATGDYDMVKQLDKAGMTITPQSLVRAIASTAKDVSFGYYGTAINLVTESELQGDGTYISQGAPAVASGANVVREMCYYPLSDYLTSWSQWTVVPFVITPVKSAYLRDDPPDDDVSYLTTTSTQPSGTSSLYDKSQGTNLDYLTLFPDLPSGSIIIKVMLKARAVVAPAGANVDFYLWFGGGDLFVGATVAATVPPLGHDQITIDSGRAGVWADYQWDLDRVPPVYALGTPDQQLVNSEGSPWSEALVRKITHMSFGAGSWTGVDPGSKLTAMKLCVVYITPSAPNPGVFVWSRPKGVKVFDSTVGGWVQWEGQD